MELKLDIHKQQFNWQDLQLLMDDLRTYCPWDKKQTIHSLRTLTIEETYELCDAILQNDYKGIEEEIGDLLLHLVFYAKIGEEEQQFTLASCIDKICKKLIHRHPHVYASATVKNEEEVKQNWEKLKLKEGKQSILQGVPNSLPAIVKAIRIQEKAKQVGFEWDNIEQVWDKVDEETKELHEAIETKDKEKIEEEFGDLLFALINYSRFLQIDAETALEKTNQKFVYRFKQMEKMATEKGKALYSMSLQELDELWNVAKQNTKL
jgi:MazG family protein